jgi:hypothetical protein
VDREELLRLLVLRAAPPALDLRALPLALDLRPPVDAPEDRAEEVPEDFARTVVLRFAPEPVLERARVPVDRALLERAPPELLEERPLSELDPPSSDHLPERTRCAASATASAISEPSFDALDTTVLAAA